MKKSVFSRTNMNKCFYSAGQIIVVIVIFYLICLVVGIFLHAHFEHPITPGDQ